MIKSQNRFTAAALLLLFVSLLAVPAQAQLERVVADAKGIT